MALSSSRGRGGTSLIRPTARPVPGASPRPALLWARLLWLSFSFSLLPFFFLFPLPLFSCLPNLFLFSPLFLSFFPTCQGIFPILSPFSRYTVYTTPPHSYSEAGHSQGPGYFSVAGLPQECVQFPGTHDKVIPNFSSSRGLRNYTCLGPGCVWRDKKKRESRAVRWVNDFKLPILELVFGLGISVLQRRRPC